MIFENDYQDSFKQLKSKFDKARMYYHNQKGKKEQLERQEAELSHKHFEITKEIEVLEKVNMLFKTVSEYAREQSKVRIETFVTNCPQYIFDANMEFKIEINENRGRPEANFYVVSTLEDGREIKTKPEDSRGGGIVDIISIAIRVAMLESSSIDIKGPLILDEPAKHVSEHFINRTAEFIKRISQMFDRQVIMVTHNRHLSEMSNKWYKIELANGTSRVSIDS